MDTRQGLEQRLCPGCDEHFACPRLAGQAAVCVACERGVPSSAGERRARHLALLDRWPVRGTG